MLSDAYFLAKFHFDTAENEFGDLDELLTNQLSAWRTGLNLVEACNVVHYERGWNPQKERQAEDRVHRLGQRKDVNVYQLISVGLHWHQPLIHHPK